jgi:2-(1,2-epoxy-1,2-dihydrophenyl)acetyl-CoA isomerase
LVAGLGSCDATGAVGYEHVIVETDGPVTTVRLNNQARLNALSAAMTAELIGALTATADDPGVRAVVLTGEGRGFSVGADLAELEEPYRRGQPPPPSRFLKDGYNRLIPLLVEMPKPVVAAINGVTAGAGISVALACDYRIASDGASFTTAFVKIGLVPDAGSSYLLPRTVGTAKALELAILSDRVDAETALAIGLVNRVVPGGSLQKEATELAGRLGGLPTAAIGLIKRTLTRSAHASLTEALDLEAEAQDEAAATHDHLEGVLAFLEKRQPNFTGS